MFYTFDYKLWYLDFVFEFVNLFKYLSWKPLLLASKLACWKLADDDIGLGGEFILYSFFFLLIFILKVSIDCPSFGR